MTLENTIKSTKLEGEDHRLALNIMHTGSWMLSIANRSFAAYGITNPQYNVLSILKGCYPNSMNVGNVQSRMVDKSSNVTRLALKLREKGYVVQFSNPSNKRIQELRITSEGLALLSEAAGSKQKVLGHLQHLSDDEMTTLNLLLDKARLLQTEED
jgi:DNA-binding MarR family transcriptional regulator